MNVIGKRVREDLSERFQVRAVIGVRRGDAAGVLVGQNEEMIEVLFRPGADTPAPGDRLEIATVNGAKPFVLPQRKDPPP